ncbi:hypothetical protein CGRA01v4_07522 [Colletotrichum graminicola]|nr:hypothetical protein CGRA01v4_07522 [Colletotrichum graminicola]
MRHVIYHHFHTYRNSSTSPTIPFPSRNKTRLPPPMPQDLTSPSIPLSGLILNMGRLSLLVTAFLAACVSANPARKTGIAGVFNILDGVTFSNRQTWDFSTLSDGAKLPKGLWASQYPIGDTHEYLKQNVFIQGGYLNLRVDGGQTAMPYRSGEVTTKFSNIKYASVRTVAIFSETPGVCNGHVLLCEQ